MVTMIAWAAIIVAVGMLVISLIIAWSIQRKERRWRRERLEREAAAAGQTPPAYGTIWDPADGPLQVPQEWIDRNEDGTEKKP